MCAGEDRANTPGSRVEAEIKKNVSQPVTWAAPHIGADGKKNWLDLVGETGAPKKEEKEGA